MFIVHLRNGTTLKESDGVSWKDIPHHDITSLQIHRPSGQTFTLSADGSNVHILQLKRALLSMGFNPSGYESGEITERVIGFIYEDRLAVKLEVDERSGSVKLTVEEKRFGGKGWRKL